MTRTDIVAICKEHNIALEVRCLQCDARWHHFMHFRQAWGPLVRGFRFEHPSIIGLAAKYGKTPAQVLLRYSLQKVLGVQRCISTVR